MENKEKKQMLTTELTKEKSGGSAGMIQDKSINGIKLQVFQNGTGGPVIFWGMYPCLLYTSTEDTLYEVHVMVEDGGEFDLSDTEKEIKIAVILGNKWFVFKEITWVVYHKAPF